MGERRHRPQASLTDRMEARACRSLVLGVLVARLGGDIKISRADLDALAGSLEVSVDPAGDLRLHVEPRAVVGGNSERKSRVSFHPWKAPPDLWLMQSHWLPGACAHREHEQAEPCGVHFLDHYRPSVAP